MTYPAPDKNTRMIVLLTALLVVLNLASAGCGGVPQASDPTERASIAPDRMKGEIRRVSTDSLIEDLTNRLAVGHGNTEAGLRLAKLDAVVDDILTIDGAQLHDVEGEELIREVYRRAEAHTPGQGRRVLAHLYGTAASRFPAVEADPAYDDLRRVIAESSAEQLDPERMRFAPAAQAKGVPLPAAVESAIQELSYVYSSGHLPQLSRELRLAAEKPIHFSRHLARSNTTADAIRSALGSHRPPPKVPTVLRRVMAAAARQPAVASSERFRVALEKLGPEVADFDADDRTYETLARNQDDLASRGRQIAQSQSVDMPGSIGKHVANVRRGVPVPPVGAAAGIPRQESAQHYASYQEVSFESRTRTRPGHSSGPGYQTSAPGSAYREVVQKSDAPRVARRFRTAIRSARAARGVAAGADFETPSGYRLDNIAWVANHRDNRFGRIVAELTPGNGDESLLARSRTLFGDSVHAAMDVLWGGHEGLTEFVEGEILVVMSMDPFSQPDPERSAEIERRAEALKATMEKRDEEDLGASLQVLQELILLNEDASKVPRRIVLHPSLYARELAWSVARVDFWFNDIAGLSEESAAVNGGVAMPDEFREIDISSASTWQFYEKDGRVDVAFDDGEVGDLSVVSTDGSTRGHYSVSMFVFDESSGPDGKRLQDLERQLQPMLDWLAVNHHDFIRLNDFSEAFTLLRWARRDAISPLVYDLEARDIEIATPDRVVIGEGPGTR